MTVPAANARSVQRKKRERKRENPRSGVLVGVSGMMCCYPATVYLEQVESQPCSGHGEVFGLASMV